jgi:single-stranded-DNA-specific exonuclease
LDQDEGGLALGVTRSLSGRRWRWRAGDERIAAGITQRQSVPEIVGRLLAAREIGIDAAADFLEPTLRSLLPDPSVLADMDLAADRLADAARRGETIAVYGDYDVDGACSAALLTGFLRNLGCSVLTHVPDRIREGYGPNAPALAQLVVRGASLIVCVDCGTAAGSVLASVFGQADVIVLDHHKSDGPAPTILATVNPNRLDDHSGLGSICAAGVTFLTMVATLRALRRLKWFADRPEPNLLGMLDLVALATVCDVMPLVGINRAFVCQGLKIMARRLRPGIAALLDVTQARERLNASTCGFALGPRINAGGRIAEADLGLRLLLSEDRVEALALAEKLEAVNRQRQDVEASILQTAMEMAEGQVAAGHATLVIAGEGWHPGVVGIVAGRLKERFNRPACVAGLTGGIAKGSGRSVAGIDLGAAIIGARQAGLLLTGGGHAMAAGFSMRAEDSSAFHAFLNERLANAATLPTAADLVVEGVLSVPGATTELAKHLERLAPFGAGNEEPVLILNRARVLRADRVGREATTVRAFVEGEGGGPRVKVMLFRAREGALAEAMLSRADSSALHLAGHLRAEEWNGTTSPCFVVTDAAVA